MLTTPGDVFDEADFNVGEGENPDEVAVDTDAQKIRQPPTPIGRPNVAPKPPSYASGAPTNANPSTVTPSKPERPMSHPPPGRQIPNQAANNRPCSAAAHDQYPNQRRSVPPPETQTAAYQNGRSIPPGQQRASHGSAASAASAQVPIKQEYVSGVQNPQAQDMAPPGTPGMDGQAPPVIGFFSARGVDMLRENPHSAAANAPVFDPHAESPSIRKTAGVDHTKTLPVSRPMLAGGASPAPNQSRDFINPSADMHRKIGVPGGAGSPMNRGPSTSSYRPLTRPNVDTKATTNSPAASRGGFGPPNVNGKRPPLNDVTNASIPGGNGPTPIPNPNDPKRVRFDGSLPPQQQPRNQQQHQ